MPTHAVTKPFLTLEQQVDLLESRGLAVPDRQDSISTLSHINYYRLSAYSLTMRQNDIFYSGTEFKNIVELYRCDEAFRLLVLKYSALVESSFRTYIAYYFSQEYSPLGYLNNQYFSDEARHAKFIEKLYNLINFSKDVFIEHHKNDLSGIYPFWVAIEITTFDVLSKMYKNLLSKDKAAVAKQHYGLPYAYIENWLEAAVIARNISAHGGRFYNRPTPFKVKLSAQMQGKFDNNKAFAFVFAVYNMLPSAADKDSLLVDFSRLFTDYPFALPKHFGFPAHWETFLLSCQSTKEGMGLDITKKGFIPV